MPDIRKHNEFTERQQHTDNAFPNSYLTSALLPGWKKEIIKAIDLHTDWCRHTKLHLIAVDSHNADRDIITDLNRLSDLAGKN